MKLNGSKKRRFFQRRGRRLRTVTILPSLITLINGICGFAAIGLASLGPEKFALAGYMIFFAMIADMLDGRVARMSHTTSSFGGQLDSLCDMLSFGAAPAILMFRVLMVNFPDLFGPETFFLTDFFRRFLWLAGTVYFSCAAIRLARFNVENIADETAHMSFTGLPTPSAAGVLASLVILFEHTKAAPVAADAVILTVFLKAILYALPFIAIGTGALMVSRITYPHLVNQYLRGKKPFAHLFTLAMIFALIWLAGFQAALMICFCGFALTGVSRWVWKKVLRRHPRTQEHPQSAEHTAPAGTDF